ncbi:MAG: hypothetical protein NC078_02660 [Ruminococcus sp.]|nr:hypothetical protein [Ruminococcus sp.]
MEDINEFLIDKRTEDRFNRLFAGALKKNKYTAQKRSKDYYTVSDGAESLGFDISEEKFNYAKSRDPEWVQRLLERVTREFYILSRLVSFTNGQEFIRYTIMRGEEVGRDMIAEDFMGGLKKVVCYTGDDVKARHIGEEYIKKWDVPKEVLFSVADRNMCRLLRKTAFTESVMSDGSRSVRCLDFKAEGNDFTVALMMCADFRSYISARLSPKFLVAVPSKDTIIVMSEVTNDVVERLGTAIVSEFRFASRPLTTDIFLYSSAGVEVAGHFAETDG